jgi:hypothetical protein
MCLYLEIGATSFGPVMAIIRLLYKNMNIEALLFRKGSFNVHVFVEQPDDGHNRPKLEAQISK